MSVELVLASELPAQIDLEPARRVVAALNVELAPIDGQLNLAFVSRSESQELNQRYSGNDYATDVLSFSYIEDGEAIDGVIGDIAICHEIALEQAKAAGTSPDDEVALLALHGTLHVLGYDHQTEAEQSSMQSLQQALMTQAGNKYRELIWEA
jgi:probable rRNA maturation factor